MRFMRNYNGSSCTQCFDSLIVSEARTPERQAQHLLLFCASRKSSSFLWTRPRVFPAFASARLHSIRCFLLAAFFVMPLPLPYSSSSVPVNVISALSILGKNRIWRWSAPQLGATIAATVNISVSDLDSAKSLNFVMAGRSRHKRTRQVAIRHV